MSISVSPSRLYWPASVPLSAVRSVPATCAGDSPWSRARSRSTTMRASGDWAASVFRMSVVPGTVCMTASTWLARSTSTSASSPVTRISTPPPPPANMPESASEMFASGIRLISGRSASTMSVVLRSRSFLSTTCTLMVAVLALPPPPPNTMSPPPPPTLVRTETVSGTCSSMMRSASWAAWSVAVRLVPAGISMLTTNLASSSCGIISVPTRPLTTR